jgi:hypothetical protein
MSFFFFSVFGCWLAYFMVEDIPQKAHICLVTVSLHEALGRDVKSVFGA